MNPLNPFFAIIIFFIAFTTAYIINLKFKITNNDTRYETIDGIRGFLAIGVFIHHASIWFQYLQIKSWVAPKSNLYNQLGQTSVSLFFMITSFLFITKLLNSENQKINWPIIFISRFFRLVPMYLVSIFLLISIVFIISDWQLNVPPFKLLKEVLQWGTFTILSSPTINDLSFTHIINAGVVWSLPYEWLFYFSLPIISILIFKKKTSFFYTVISLFFILCFFKIYGSSIPHLLSFLGGVIPPFIIKYNTKKINFNSNFYSIIILLCLGLILLFHTSDNYICKLLIIIVFNLIALGNEMFGVLKNTTLKFLGEISYSTYLIHGIIIFITLYFGFSLEVVEKMPPSTFCSIIFLITPIIILTSFLSYRNIEKPFMDYSKKINYDKIKHSITEFHKRKA
ncbi:MULTISPECIES: acyltransferase family protein [Flavobacterium]|uniref:acyltransferase family protein n=1 Tax=Flavobacterium TaxID=237 RepID=UPI0013D7D093|nr:MULTISPECIES: acyltransferase [Flavobacterium]MCJ1805886.1 acyltransferase [Flavobacterium covae]